MNANTDFYVLEFALNPGYYYCDNLFRATNEVMKAERYSSAEEALEFTKTDSKWNICKVHIDVKHI